MGVRSLFRLLEYVGLLDQRVFVLRPSSLFVLRPVPSLTVENYVKAIYQICSEQQASAAATGQIAAALDVLPGTVTSMLKTLSESNLATYTPYEGVRADRPDNAWPCECCGGID